ncbi:malate dehydrogenase-like [Polyergus mexicanus]|uniref:malate dehydrogenase-like n=1 Tax=Polyergus mexicanus TaxID=615972 RepID=UPI0038B47348
MYNAIRLISKSLQKIEQRRCMTFNRTKNEHPMKEREELKYIRRCRVAIVGLGGVGKSLAHLLKTYPGGLTELRLCNRSDPEGIVEELNHIPTRLPVRGFKGIDRLPLGLQNADLVIVTAGVARRPGMQRRQLFTENAAICRDIINICADRCPDALIAIVTNPLDSMVPVAAGVLKKRGVYRPEKLFGVCQIDQMRAGRFYAEAIGQEPRKTYVPVVGGHAENTTVPLFSKARPNVPLTEEETKILIQLVRNAGKKVVQAKKGAGGSTYSMASATLNFVHKLCRAIHHEPHVILSAYVESTVTSAHFFSNELLLGPRGIHRNLGYGTVTKFEQDLIDEAVIVLQRDIALADDFIKKNV